jgi:hypothetical protein
MQSQHTHTHIHTAPAPCAQTTVLNILTTCTQTHTHTALYMLTTHYYCCISQQTRSPPVVPNLQALPPDWQGAVPGIPTPTAPSRHLPQHRTRHPTDGRVYNTYFMPPTLEAQAALQQYGARNTETCAQVRATTILVSVLAALITEAAASSGSIASVVVMIAVGVIV